MGICAIIVVMKFSKLAGVYRRNAPTFWTLFFVLVPLLIISQSWIAKPRSLATLLCDTWGVWLGSLPLLLLLRSKKERIFLGLSAFYFILTLLMFLKILPLHSSFGTVFFIFSVFFAVDLVNLRRFDSNVIIDLLSGDTTIASGLFGASFFLGILVEVANIPFALWWYNWPFAAITLGGTPVIMILFGWMPWVAAIYAFFYPVSVKRKSIFVRIGSYLARLVPRK